MRLTTLILVLALSAVAGSAWANGAGPTTPPSEEEGVTAPPADTTTPTMPPSTETVMPPPSTGTTAPTPPTTTMMQAMTPEVETFNTNLVASTFGTDRTSITSLRQAGWTWGDIHLMANIANRTARPVLEIANWRGQGLAWTDIAARYNLTAMDITTPMMVRTRVAGYAVEYGYQPLYYRTDPWGNPVLTRYDAQRLMRLGYNWQDIAIAANISAVTGANIRDVLSWIDRGYTWPMVAREYSVNPKRIMDVSKYPFARERGAAMFPPPTTMPPTGAGPMGPVEPSVTPPTVPPNY